MSLHDYCYETANSIEPELKFNTNYLTTPKKVDDDNYLYTLAYDVKNKIIVSMNVDFEEAYLYLYNPKVKTMDLVKLKGKYWGYTIDVYIDGKVHILTDGLDKKVKTVSNYLFTKEQRVEINKAVETIFRNLVEKSKPKFVTRVIDTNKAKLNRYIRLRNFLEKKGYFTKEIAGSGNRLVWFHIHPKYKDYVLYEDKNIDEFIRKHNLKPTPQASVSILRRIANFLFMK